MPSPHPIADRHSTVRASIDEHWDVVTTTSDGETLLLSGRLSMGDTDCLVH